MKNLFAGTHEFRKTPVSYIVKIRAIKRMPLSRFHGSTPCYRSASRLSVKQCNWRDATSKTKIFISFSKFNLYDNKNKTRLGEFIFTTTKKEKSNFIFSPTQACLQSKFWLEERRKIFYNWQNEGMCVFLFIPQLDNHEIKPGKSVKVNISVPNLRLFVGNIPKSKGKEEILDEFGKITGKVNSRRVLRYLPTSTYTCLVYLVFCTIRVVAFK